MSSSSSSLQWLSLVGTIWLQTINGPNTDFPVYSSELKKLKQFSQERINFLALASDAGKLFGWFSGVAAIHLPLWLVAVVGAAFELIGYGLQYLFLDKPHFTYPHILGLTALAGNGICWINTACYLICIKNFASDTRIAVDLSTSYVGLSAKVYTVVASAVFRQKSQDKAKNYLLLNAVVPVLVVVVVAPFLREFPSKNNATRTSRGFIAMFVITLATGISAVVVSIGSTSLKYKLILALLLASPLLIPVAAKLREAMEEIWRNKKENRLHDLTVDDVEAGERVDQNHPEFKEERYVEERVILEEEPEVGGLRILKKVDFWLYFFSYMFSATLGLVFLNNLGQIAESRGLREEVTSTLVSLSYISGFFGSLMQFLLDYYSSKRNCMVSRPASMATLMAPMAGAFFVLLHQSRLSLYTSTATIGASTGAITSVAVSATTELFGTKHFSVNHNIVIANIPIGSLVFGYLAAFLYQRGAGEGSYKCTGAGCYDKSFIIWGATCSLGSLLCTVLYMRKRKPIQ